MESFALHHGCCLEKMGAIPDVSIDLILCDLPYGTTDCKWDSVIPLDPLWAAYRRILTKAGAAVLTSNQPFTTDLIQSNRKQFRYQWIWIKSMACGFLNAYKAPLRKFEDILVFAVGPTPYFPQGIKKLAVPKPMSAKCSAIYRGHKRAHFRTHENFPSNILHFKSERGTHPTQKPVPLFEYLIRTYTRPGAIVLDNCMGSGTTGVACARSGRRFIGIERDAKYFAQASARITEAFPK
jgi:site-specific DNA-methyltransferase (adenine-specific)